MKKLTFILIILLTSTIGFTQTYKTNSVNNNFTGYNKLSSTKLKVGATSLTETKVIAYDKLTTDTVDIRGIAVLKTDTSDITAGSYTTRYDFTKEKTTENLIRVWQGFGSTLKLTPACPLLFYETKTLFAEVMYMNICYLPETTTITNIIYALATSGAYTASGFNGFLLYSVNPTTKIATLIAQTANNGNVWKEAPSSAHSIALTSPIVCEPGYYSISFIYNQSTQITAPVFQIYFGGAVMSSTAGIGMAISSFKTSVYDLPTTIDLNTYTNTGSVFSVFAN